MARGGEAAHVGADLGDDDLRGGATDPGDLIELVDRRLKRGDLGLDVGLQGGDVGTGLVDAGKHRLEQEGVVLGEVPGERIPEPAALAAHAAPRQLGQHHWILFPGHQRGQHGPARDPEDVAWRPPTA